MERLNLFRIRRLLAIYYHRHWMCVHNSYISQLELFNYPLRSCVFRNAICERTCYTLNFFHSEFFHVPFHHKKITRISCLHAPVLHQLFAISFQTATPLSSTNRQTKSVDLVIKTILWPWKVKCLAVNYMLHCTHHNTNGKK